ITQLQTSRWGSLDYRYDALDRLTEESGAALAQTFSYDAVGNRTHQARTTADGSQSISYQYGSGSNRLTQRNGQTVSSDAAGNLTQDRPDRQLAYDAQGRLSRVTLAGKVVPEFLYNALGQRTHTVTEQGTTTFLYGPDGQLLGETLYDAQGQKQSAQFYLWLDSLPLGGLNLSYNADGAIASSTPFYLHADHLNTPRIATGHDQQIVWQWQS